MRIPAMPSESPQCRDLFRSLLLAATFFLILMSYLCANLIYSAFLTKVAEGDETGGAGLIVGVVFVGIGYLQGAYDNHQLLNITWQIRKAAMNWVVSLTILAIAAFLLKSTAHLSRGTILLFAIIGVMSLWGHRAIWRVGFASPFAKGHFIDRKVVLAQSESPGFYLKPVQGSQKERFRRYPSFCAEFDTR